MKGTWEKIVMVVRLCTPKKWPTDSDL